MLARFLTHLTKPLILFYIVFIYIIIFSVWWSVLLFQKNTIAFDEKVELNAIGMNLSIEEFKQSASYEKLYEKFSRQRLMIITEGTTFLMLIVVGLFMVRKSFIRELDLATQQRNFLLSITHELKSPLAGIKLSIQTLLRHTLNQEKKDRLLANSLTDVERLEGLVENILLAAKFDNPSYGFANEDVEVSSILCATIRQMQGNYPRHEVEYKQAPEGIIRIKGDKLALSSVIINLVENAFKYSESAENPKICIELSASKHQIQFTISDNGVGIPADQKQKIFEKFYRIGNENTRSTKGTGLGLFIVERVVEMYDGIIKVTDNEPHGTTFKVQLNTSEPQIARNPELSVS
ncbi:MAG: HAMP domain-containing histidine kinase [Chitinophagales bacterium]|nr:HAMP domain-containing histidine kinase [Chitinophagales bacterium]